jgi:Domain of unknown function (DUF929)
MGRSNAARQSAARKRAVTRTLTAAPPQSGRQPRAAQAGLAAQRAAQVRRRNTRLALGGIGGVLVVFVVLILVATLGGGPKAAPPQTASAASTAQVAKQATSVPAAVLAQVGAGTSDNAPVAVNGAAKLTSGGKPEVLYMGYEWCPYCAAQRWAAVVALSRFGTFTGLGLTTSSSTDVYANTHTFTFANATYTSQYVAFVPVELQNSQKQPLQTPTAQENQLLQTYDAPPYTTASQRGGLPFYDFGNQYALSGTMYNPQLLSGADWDTIAAALSEPSSPIAKGVDGAANVMTAVICKLTGEQPATVCSAPSITALNGGL